MVQASLPGAKVSAGCAEVVHTTSAEAIRPARHTTTDRRERRRCRYEVRRAGHREREFDARLPGRTGVPATGVDVPMGANGYERLSTWRAETGNLFPSGNRARECAVKRVAMTDRFSGALVPTLRVGLCVVAGMTAACTGSSTGDDGKAQSGPPIDSTEVQSDASVEGQQHEKIAPPAPLMQVQVQHGGRMLKGNEWTLRLNKGDPLDVRIAARFFEGAEGARVGLRLEDQQDRHRTVASLPLTRVASDGEQVFNVQWPMEESDGRPLRAANYHLFADLRTDSTFESQGLGYVVIEDAGTGE